MIDWNQTFSGLNETSGVIVLDANASGHNSELVNLVAPENAVTGFPSSGFHSSHPAWLATDGVPETKYLNTQISSNPGLTINTYGGVANGLALTSGNDESARDPATFKLHGSIDGSTFTLITEGDVPGFTKRKQRKVISFENHKFYSYYKISFHSTVSESTSYVQISEVEVLGLSQLVYSSSNPQILEINGSVAEIKGDGNVTISAYAPATSTHSAAEVVSKTFLSKAIFHQRILIPQPHSLSMRTNQSARSLASSMRLIERVG